MVQIDVCHGAAASVSGVMHTDLLGDALLHYTVLVVLSNAMLQCVFLIGICVTFILVVMIMINSERFQKTTIMISNETQNYHSEHIVYYDYH